MKAGVTFEVKCPIGSVGFQAEIDLDDDTVRTIRKTLEPGQLWIWPVHMTASRIAVIAMQSRFACVVSIAGKETLLEGQTEQDLGVIAGRRGSETFGEFPFGDDVEEITAISVQNGEKKNHIDILIGEVGGAL